MDWKAASREAMIGGLAGLAVTIFFLATQGDVEAGDWLQFAGTTIGIGGAVLGAIRVEQWRLDRMARQACNVLEDTLQHLDNEVRVSLSPARIRVNLPNGEMLAAPMRAGGLLPHLRDADQLISIVLEAGHLRNAVTIRSIFLTRREIRWMLNHLEPLLNLSYSSRRRRGL